MGSSEGHDGEKIHDVLIVGGGFAGITAARELTSRGRSVLLLEARDRLGGRAWLKPNGFNDVPLEMGGAWIDPRERYAWAEAHRYGLKLCKPVAGSWPSTWLVQGKLLRGPLPVPAEEVRDLERLIVALNQASGISQGRAAADAFRCRAGAVGRSQRLQFLEVQFGLEFFSDGRADSRLGGAKEGR